MTKKRKCAVFNCPNESDQGEFVGKFCFPCHDFIMNGRGVYSAAYLNATKLKSENDKDTLAFALYTAWQRYLDLFGVQPRGTLRQLRALLELLPPAEAPPRPKTESNETSTNQ